MASHQDPTKATEGRWHQGAGGRHGHRTALRLLRLLRLLTFVKDVPQLRGIISGLMTSFAISYIKSWRISKNSSCNTR